MIIVSIMVCLLNGQGMKLNITIHLVIKCRPHCTPLLLAFVMNMGGIASCKPDDTVAAQDITTIFCYLLLESDVLGLADRVRSTRYA